MTFEEQSFKTARECGSYRAIADMMRREIRNLSEAQSKDDEFMADWAIRNLVSLAKQFEETAEKFEKEVDTA